MPKVNAIIVTRGNSFDFAECLESVQAQSEKLNQIIVVDVKSGVGVKIPKKALPAIEAAVEREGVHYIKANNCKTFSHAICLAIAWDGFDNDAGLIWMLHDDSVAANDALALMVDRLGVSQNVALIGPKQLLLEDDSLLEVGFGVSNSQIRFTGLLHNELDQKQFDNREDVFGVSLNCALADVNFAKQTHLADRELGLIGDSQNASIKAKLMGLRNIVVPKAVIRHRQSTLRRAYPSQIKVPDEILFAQLYHRLFIMSGIKSFLFVLLLILRIPVMVIAHHPSAGAQFRVPFKMLANFAAIRQNRAKIAGLQQINFSALKTFFVPNKTVKKLEDEEKRLIKAAEQESFMPSLLQANELKSIRAKRFWACAALAIILIGASICIFQNQWFAIIGGENFAGDFMRRFDFSSIDLAKSVIPSMDGQASNPFNFALFAYSLLGFGSLQFAMNWIVLLSPLLIGLSAFFAIGCISRSNLVRIAGSLIYALSIPALESISSGIASSITAMIFLPLAIGLAMKGLGKARTDLDITRPRRAYQLLLASICISFVCVASPMLFIIAITAAIILAIASRSSAFALFAMLAPSIIAYSPIYIYICKNFDPRKFSIFLSSPEAFQANPKMDAFDFANFASANLVIPFWIQIGLAAIIAFLLALSILSGAVSSAGSIALAFSAIAFLLSAFASQQIIARIVPDQFSYPQLQSSFAFILLMLIFGASSLAVHNKSSLKKAFTGLSIGACALLSIASFGYFSFAQPINALQTESGDILHTIAMNSINQNAGGKVLVFTQNDSGEILASVLKSPNLNYENYSQIDITDFLYKGATPENSKIQALAAELISSPSFGTAQNLWDYGIVGIEIPESMQGSAHFPELVSLLNKAPSLYQMTSEESFVFWEIRI